MLWRITTFYFCCGIVTNSSGYIVEAAPILQWSVGKYLNTLLNWVDGKDGEYECLEEK